jgi:cysteine-rich repeat protein
VTIPKDLECETKKLVDLSIKKTGATSPAPGVNGYSFNLAVTNVGAPFNGTNAITITDAVPAGMTFNSATSPDWLCATLPASTGSITCTYTGAGPVSAGQVLSTIAISATANGKAPFPPFENCAVVGTLPSSPYADTNPANNKSCVTVKKPDVIASTIKVTKVCSPAKEVIGAINSYVSDCKITVTTTGPQTSLIVVNEAMTGGGVVTSAASSTTPAWNCTTANCSINGSALNQTSSTSVIDVQVKFNNAGLAVESKNCAKLSVGQNPVPKPDGVSCTGFTVSDTPFKLDVKKDCSGVIALTVNGPWAGYCKITVTATGGPRPPFIAFNEQLSDTNASHSTVFGISAQQSADPWNCMATSITGPLNCVIAGNAFPANGTSEILIPVQVPLGMKTGEAKNCVNAFGAADAQGLAPSVPSATTAEVCVPLPGGKDTPPPAGDGTLSVTKACDPAVQTPGAQTATAQCRITVTGTGTLPPVITVNETLNGLGNPTNQITAMTSAQNWTYPALPVADGVAAPITISGADLTAAGGTSVINVAVQLFDLGTAMESQNCVEGAGTDANGNALVPPMVSPKVCVPLTASQPTQAICGDAVLAAPEQCDDGNSANTDACLNSCTTATCGDGVVRTGVEQCDDGNSNPNDGCSNTCTLPVVTQTAKCDPSTATPAGDLCRCRFNNMNPVSKTACECKDGFTLKAGKGCVPIVVTPKCDPATTVTKGNACVCEYKNMVQVSKTACACAKGFKFAPGKGCFKPEPVCKKSERFNPARGRCEPVCAKGFDYNPKRNACIQQRPDCPQGTVYNAKRNRCDPVQPVCRKPFVYDAKRNACVEQVRRCEPGTIPFKGKCIRTPKCGFGQIPIPGTGICVSIGGGGGGGGGPKDPPRGEPTCVPKPGAECQ